MVSKTLFLTLGMSHAVVMEQLRIVQTDKRFRCLHMVNFSFDLGGDGKDVLELLLQVFKSRAWNTIKLHRCRGKYSHRVVQAAMAAKVRQLLLAPTRICSQTTLTALSIGLAAKACSISTLYLSKVRWNRGLMELVAASFARNTSLADLAIEYCVFPSDDSTAHQLLAEALAQQSSSLQHLSLAHCSLEDDQCRDLIGALCNNPLLLELNLEGNKCNVGGLEALSVLVSRSSLLVLDLSSQKVKEGMQGMDLGYLSPGLAKSKIRCLQLGNNRLETRSLQALAKALKNNTCLQTLHLAWTVLDQASMLALANSLRWNTTLQTLVLYECGIDNFGLSRLANRLSQIRGLLHLDLGGKQNFDAAGLWSLQGGLQRNEELQHVILPQQEDPLFQAAAQQVFFLCDVNRGGRRFLKCQHQAPAGLWPLVLSAVWELETEDGNSCDHLLPFAMEEDESTAAVAQSQLLDLSRSTGSHVVDAACSQRTNHVFPHSKQAKMRQASVFYHLLRNGASLQLS